MYITSSSSSESAKFLTVIGVETDSPALENGIGLKVDFLKVLSLAGSIKNTINVY